MKTCAIYARVSTSEQSCEIQVKELQDFALRRGWAVSVVFEEKMSGTTANRPQLKQLQKLVAERKIDIVLTWKLDRLFRSLRDLLTTLQHWSEVGVEFISLRDNVDLTTSSGRLMMQLLGAFGEFEAALIRERVRSGIANAKTKGIKLGRPSVTVDTKLIESLLNNGLTYKQISQKLNISTGTIANKIKAKS